MPAWVFIVGVILLLVVGMLAVDWFSAGRVKRRGVRAKDQYASDANVGYTVLERQQQSIQDQTGHI
jgi:hypothetical protein